MNTTTPLRCFEQIFLIHSWGGPHMQNQPHNVQMGRQITPQSTSPKHGRTDGRTDGMQT